MGVRPAVSVPPISPAEMEQMVSRAGLVLNPGQMADLVLAWRQVVQLAALIGRDRPYADDFSAAFRLPPPEAKKGAKKRGARKPAPVSERAASRQRAASAKRAPRSKGRKIAAGRR